jgi:hypothetical protein
MPEFVKIFNMQGWDRHATPVWQMVPRAGKRYVALRDGKGLTVLSLNPAVVSVREIKVTDLPAGGERMPLQWNDRIFELSGGSKGSALVVAVGVAPGPGVIPSVHAAALQVDTKDKKTVRICFNFVKDSAGHSTRRVPAQAANWVATMNYIYNGQANVFIERKDARVVNVATNLGHTIETLSNAAGEEVQFYPLGDASADINMFLVWNMDITDDTADEDAFADGKNIVFEDNAGHAIGVTMSHEVGHVLGLPDHYNTATWYQLMYGITDKRGVDLPRGDVNKINP